MKKIIGIGVVFGICLLAGCSKNEVPAYSDLDKVYFYERHLSAYSLVRAEEISYSFAAKSNTITEGRLEIKVRLQGRVDEERDRVVCAEVIADSTTAVEGTHYRLEKGVIKAGEYEGVLPLTFYRTPDMKTEILQIKLRIADSDDLKAGLEEEAYIRVLVSDQLIKPDNWDWELKTYFGEYSPNKYRFIMNTLGIESFGLLYPRDQPTEGKYTPTQYSLFVYQLREAYKKHREEEGPIYMYDDADPKEEISFNN